jgi:hypothetical protein
VAVIQQSKSHYRFIVTHFALAKFFICVNGKNHSAKVQQLAINLIKAIDEMGSTLGFYYLNFYGKTDHSNKTMRID